MRLNRFATHLHTVQQASLGRKLPEAPAWVAEMSDTHLSSNPLDAISLNQSRKQQFKKLFDAIGQVNDEHPVYLYLDGDIMEMVLTWPVEKPPWQLTHFQQVPIAKTVLNDDIVANKYFFERLKAFIQNNKANRVTYVIGNHDRWMTERVLQQQFLNAMHLTSSQKRQVVFEDEAAYDLDYRLLVMHGHQLNAYHTKSLEVDYGEFIVIGGLSRLAKHYAEALKQDGASREIQQAGRHFVESLHEVRPNGALAHYVATQVNQLETQWPASKTRNRIGAKQLFKNECQELLLTVQDDPFVPSNIKAKIATYQQSWNLLRWVPTKLRT